MTSSSVSKSWRVDLVTSRIRYSNVSFCYGKTTPIGRGISPGKLLCYILVPRFVKKKQQKKRTIFIVLLIADHCKRSSMQRPEIGQLPQQLQARCIWRSCIKSERIISGRGLWIRVTRQSTSSSTEKTAGWRGCAVFPTASSTTDVAGMCVCWVSRSVIDSTITLPYLANS